jgi:hypothetical protein
MYKWKRLIYDLGLDYKEFIRTSYIYVHCTDVRKWPSPYLIVHHACCFVISRHKPKFMQQKKNALFDNNIEFERTLIVVFYTAPK